MEASLTEKILQLHRSGEMEALNQLVITLLSPQFREQGLVGLNAVLKQVDGRTRLKVMEFMLEDGGEDLIPFFLERLKAELNLLYAKSILQLYSHFEHESALSELLSIEHELHPDMKSTYQRIVARFRADFRESFYISEFDSGNARRMNNAMRMMITEPHPAYLPYLTQVLEERDVQKLTFAIAVLRHLADANTMPAVFRFIENLYREIQTAKQTQTQIALLKSETFKDHHFFKALATLTGLKMIVLRGSWIDARRADEEQQEAATQMFLDKCCASYPIKIENVQRYFREWLSAVLKNSKIPTVESHRLQESIMQHEQKFRPLVDKALRAQSEIAERCKHVTDRIDALQVLIPDTDPQKAGYILYAAKGFRSQRAQDVLIEFTTTSDDRETLKAALEGLALFQTGEIFPRLQELALNNDPNKRALRNAAFHVLARWGLADQLLDTLFKEKDPEAQIDIVRLIGEDRLTVAKPVLTELLTKGAESDFLAAILTALSYFPDEDNTDYILPYFKEQQYPSVRQAAMKAVLCAGGAERFAIFVAQVKGASARFGAEMLEFLFKFLAEEKAEDYAEDFYRQVDCWFELLDSPNEGWRKKLLSALEALDFEAANLSLWLLAFEELTQHSQHPRTLNEKKRLSVLHDKLSTLRKNRLLHQKQHERLADILQQYKSGEHLEKIKAMRRLGTLFQPAMFENNLVGQNQTVTMVTNFFQTITGDINLIMLGIHVAAKIQAEAFTPLLQSFLEHANEDVVNEARKGLGLKPVTHQRIEKVFIIDDSRYITRQLSNVLSGAGYDVQTENHAATGLTTLASTTFDLLILDLNMPEMEGLALLDQARAQHHVPENVIAIASNRDREEIQAAASRGVAGILFKPFPMNDLLTRIKNLETAHSEASS